MKTLKLLPLPPPLPKLILSMLLTITYSRSKVLGWNIPLRTFRLWCLEYSCQEAKYLPFFLDSLLRGRLPSILRFPRKMWFRQGHYSRSEVRGTKMSPLKILIKAWENQKCYQSHIGKRGTLSQALAWISLPPARSKTVTTKPSTSVRFPFLGLLYSGNRCGRERVIDLFYD